ncbi:MAG: thioredoxin family protein [candidate division WOR-3 bacterium]
MIIKILGSGCPNCQKLEQNAKKAVEELGLSDVRVEHIYDIDKIVEMGIALTPAIMINGEIKAEGRIPDVEEIKGWLQEIKK